MTARVRSRDNDGTTISVLGDMDNSFVMGVACIPKTNEIVSVTDDAVLKFGDKMVQSFRKFSTPAACGACW